MCYELSDFDPFEPLIILDGYKEYLDSEPMTVDDWDSWLDVTMENTYEA